MTCRYLLALLLLPCCLHSQQKKTPLKKKKPARSVLQSKFLPPKLPDDEVTTPAPVVAAEPPRAAAETPLVKSTSLQEALDQAASRKTGLVVLAPFFSNSQGERRYNTAFANSNQADNFYDELFDHGNNYYGRKYLVYMLSGTGLAASKKFTPALYPACFFLNADGVLLGSVQGLKMDAYDIESTLQDLLLGAEKKELAILQEKYNAGLADRLSLEKLLLLTQRFNAVNYGHLTAPDQYTLLESLVKKYSQPGRQDTNMIKTVRLTCLNKGYITDIKKPHTIFFIIENYKSFEDEHLTWYNAISSQLSDAWASLPKTGEAVKAGADAVATPAAPDALKADSIFLLQQLFLQQLPLVLQLNEGDKMCQAQYDAIKNQQVNEDYIDAHALPFFNWYFDSLLQVGNGLVRTRQLIKDEKEKAPLPVTDFLMTRYNSYEGFEASCMNNLALQLNNISWLIFQRDTANQYLDKLMQWSKASLQQDAANPYYLDTYAQLLYAKGNKIAAAENEQKAINILTTNKKYKDERWMLPFMKKVTATMKAGGRLGREDYPYP